MGEVRTGCESWKRLDGDVSSESVFQLLRVDASTFSSICSILQLHTNEQIVPYCKELPVTVLHQGKSECTEECPAPPLEC